MVQGLQQLTQHWRNGSNMCIWSLLRWIITTWGTEMSPFQNYSVGLTQSSLCPQIFLFVLLYAPAFPTFLPHFFASACVCVCGWLCQARQWQGVGCGLWTWPLCLALPVTESKETSPGRGCPSWTNEAWWISTCLPPCAALWHRSPYGS